MEMDERSGVGEGRRGLEGHPKAWVSRLVSGRSLKVPERSLAWWSVHLERFLGFCRKLGKESSADPGVAAKVFLESLSGESGPRAQFAREQARQALEDRLKERTLTKLYNERPKWLADCHTRLDAAVAAAYGWPRT